MEFIITQRQYDLILKQGVDCLPEETGGFLGGEDGVIKAVLPVANIAVEDREKKFAFSKEYYQRAHEFFSKHGLHYYGVYHTHPKGEAKPSFQDLKLMQRYQFIISLRKADDPDMAAFVCKGMSYRRVPIRVISNKGVEIAVDGLEKQAGQSGPLENEVVREADALSDMFDKILQNNAQYSRLSSTQDGSDFSTLA